MNSLTSRFPLETYVFDTLFSVFDYLFREMEQVEIFQKAIIFLKISVSQKGVTISST